MINRPPGPRVEIPLDHPFSIPHLACMMTMPQQSSRISMTLEERQCTGSRSFWWVAVAVLIQAVDPGPAHGEEADNALSAEEKKDGWLLLFDGKSLDGWQTSSGQPSKVPVEDGCINPHGSGGYMMIHQKTWANFVLSLDFKISKGCNSGVFIRTYPLTPRPGKDVGFNGIEVAIDDTKTADLSRYRGNLRPGQTVEKRHEARGQVEPHGDYVRRAESVDRAKRRNRHPHGPGPVDGPQPSSRRLGAQVRHRL